MPPRIGTWWSATTAPSTGPPNGRGPIHAMTLAEVRALDNAYWFVPGGDETQGLEPEAYPYRGRAPADAEFDVATLAEVLDVLDDHPARRAQSRHQADGTGRRALRGAPRPRARRPPRHRPGDRGVVPRHRHRLVRQVRARHRHLGGNARRRHVLACGARGRGAARPRRTWRCRFPPPKGTSSSWTSCLVSAAHETRDGRPRVDDQRRAEMARLLDLGVDGIISDLPTPLVSLVAARGTSRIDPERPARRLDDGLSRARSWAACRGSPSSCFGSCA